MERHPYIGLRATVGAYLQPGRTGHKPEYTAIIVAIGTDSEECDGYAVHYPCAVLLMADGSHEVAPMHRVRVDPTEAAARLAPAQVERWQTYRTYDGMHLDDHFVKTGAPEGFEAVGIWEPVSAGYLPVLPGTVVNVKCDLWKRPLRRIRP